MTLTDRENALRLRIEQMGIAHPERVRQLISFAWACVQKTPLARLRGRTQLQNALHTLERWLNGEPVEQPLRAMHDEVFEAVLGLGRYEPDMTGLRAACWSVYELYQAALAVAMGEMCAAASKAAWAVSLSARSYEDGLTASVLAGQEELFAEAFQECKALS